MATKPFLGSDLVSIGSSGRWSRTQKQTRGARECKVESSWIGGASYEPESKNLITNLNGRTYVYQNVSPQMYAAFCKAPSKGRFLNLNIKGKYAYRRLG